MYRIYSKRHGIFISRDTVLVDGTGTKYVLDNGILKPMDDSEYVIQRISGGHKYADGVCVGEGDIVYFSAFGKINTSTVTVKGDNFKHSLDFYGVLGALYYGVCIGNEVESVKTIDDRILAIKNTQINENVTSGAGHKAAQAACLKVITGIHGDMPKNWIIV